MVEGTPPVTLPWIPSEARLCNFHSTFNRLATGRTNRNSGRSKNKKGKTKKTKKKKKRRGVLCVRGWVGGRPNRKEEREREQKGTPKLTNCPNSPKFHFYFPQQKERARAKPENKPHPGIYSLLLFSSLSHHPIRPSPSHPRTHHYTMEAPLPAGW